MAIKDRTLKIERLEKKVEDAEDKIYSLKEKIKVWKGEIKRLKEEEKHEFLTNVAAVLIENGIKTEDALQEVLEKWKKANDDCNAQNEIIDEIIAKNNSAENDENAES